MLVERIAAFIRGELGDSFEELALAVFRAECERSAPYRDLCERRGAAPERVADWRQVPAVPAATHDHLAPGHGAAAAERRRRDLLQAVVDRSFATACLAGLNRPPVLSLLPTAGEPTDPGPGLVAERILGAWAAPDSRSACSRRGIEVASARSFLAARQRDRRPTVILATPETLARLLAALDRRGLRFRLPPGSRVVESGRPGPQGPQRLSRLAESLAVPAEAVIRDYGAPGLASRFYAGHDRNGEPRPFRPPVWTRVRLLDRRTPAEVPVGATGRIAIFDLAAVGGPPCLLTGDLGKGGGEDGFRLAGGSPGPSHRSSAGPAGG